MRSVALLLVVFSSVYPLHAGRTIRISSPQFSFLIDEPEGWMIDVRSAAQIANFVVHKQGTTWRFADVVIFGRFVPQEEGESFEDFIADDELRFKQSCPLSDIEPLEMDFDPAPPHDFLVKAFNCMGKAEVVAITQVPGFVVLLSMSTQAGEEVVERSLPVFKDLLASFRFLPRASD